MNTKIGAIIVVSIILVAGFGIFLLLGGGSSDDGIEGELTIYVESARGGDPLEATVNLNELTVGEEMMLAFGQGVRQATFSQDVSGLSKNAQYNIWGDATFLVSGNEAVSEMTGSTVRWSGVAGGTHAGAGGDLLFSDNIADKYPTIKNALTYDTESRICMADHDYKFTHVSVDDDYTLALKGEAFDGMILDVYVEAWALDEAGAEIQDNHHWQLTINVTSWMEAQLTVEITGFGAGSDYFCMDSGV